MRWSEQELDRDAAGALPGLARLNNLVRSVRTPEFAGVTFHEVLAKSALNKVPGGGGRLPFGWTVNPYRGCSHACVYCFARASHSYLELDTGHDFDSQIIVKVNVAEVLEREVHRGSWARHPVALGTNTDPYQRAEGRYRLMPGIIDALAGSGTPFSILTKGTMLRRDLDRIAEAARRVPVELAMSIAVYDDELQASIEPGTPTTTARLATVTAVRERGLDCTVFLMPILPYLTDTEEHLDAAFARAAAAGATGVVHSALHLRPGVKAWFMTWLQREHPELVARYAKLYGGGAYAPAEYRRWLARRVGRIRSAHGLARARENPATGGVMPRFSSADGAATPGRAGDGADTRMAAAGSPSPTLF